MRPEPGDRAIHVVRDDIAEAARAVGVRENDTLMFHSSLSSMGTIVGGPHTVIDGFLDAAGPEGTVAAPSLWGRLSGDVPSDLSLWDVNTSATWTGAIPEALRNRPDAFRSDNPTHSVAAVGARADELTRGHANSGGRPCCFHEDAFGTESPWQKLHDWDAAYCFVGVDFTVATMRHFVECLLMEELLQEAAPSRREGLRARLSRWGVEGIWPHHDSRRLGELLTSRGLVTVGRLGSATLRCVRARAWVEESLTLLREQPEEWFSEEFRAWLENARDGGSP